MKSDEHIFCWNCGVSEPRKNNFCRKCGSKFSQIKENQAEIPKSYHKKIKKSFLILGIAIMIFGSIAFVVPINDMGWTISDADALCKSPIGLIGQASGGEQGQKSCLMFSQLVLLASVLEIVGIILIVFGLLRNRISLR
jgi:ribosomal protein L40E